MPDPIDIAVGQRVKLRRKELGVSQAELAKHVALTFQQVQKYEIGSNRISASMLVKIAERLQCSVAYLVGETPATADTEGLLLELSEPGAIELVRAFAKISPRRRKALVEIARSLASVDPAG